MPDIPQLLAEADAAKLRLDGLLFRVNVQDSGEARVAATLCLTIAEQFAGVLHLVRGGFSSHAPILVRSMLEGLADLLNFSGRRRWVDQLFGIVAHAVADVLAHSGQPDLLRSADSAPMPDVSGVTGRSMISEADLRPARHNLTAPLANCRRFGNLDANVNSRSGRYIGSAASVRETRYENNENREFTTPIRNRRRALSGCNCLAPCGRRTCCIV